MAEQINIKLLIDAAESAKTVAETKKALRDLKTAALSVEEGSTAFQKINQAAGQLQDKIGDLQTTTKYFANDMRKLEGITGIAEGIAGGFALAQGAAQLFGSENKNLEASLTKLTSIMAILNGLQSVGNILQKESAATLFIQNTVRKTAIALTSEQAVAEAAEAVAAGTATVAQRALNAAMNANPIGILVTAILAGVAALTLWTNKTEDAKKKQEEHNKKIKEAKLKQEELAKERKKSIDNVVSETAELGNLLYAIRETNSGSEQRKVLMQEINNKYPGILKNLTDEAAFQQQVNLKIADYIAYQRLRILADINEGKTKKAIADQQAQIDKIQTLAANGRISQYTAEQYQLALLGKKKAGDIDFSHERLYQLWIMGGKLNEQQKQTLITLNSAQTSLSANNAVLQDAAKRELELKTELDATRKSLGLNTKETNTNTKSTKDQIEAVYDLSDAYSRLAQDVRDANYDINEMALGDAQQSIDKMVALRKLENEKILEDLKQANKDRLKAFEDAYIQEEKKLKQNTKVSDEILRERAKNNKKYKEAFIVFSEEESAKKKALEEEVTVFIAEEQLRRLELLKSYTKQILSTEEWKRFLDFSSGISISQKNLEKNFGSVTHKIREYNGDIKKLTETFEILNGVAMSSLLAEDVSPIAKQDLEAATEVIKTSIGESEKAIDILAKIYQDKLNIIKQETNKINEDLKKSGKEFAIEPVTPEQFGLDVLVNQYEDKAKQLNDALSLQYKKLVETEDEIYSKSLFKSYENYQNKLIAAKDDKKEREKVEKEYLDETEKNKEDHNDRMLLIDVAYGKADAQQMIENFKTKKEKRDAENQKIIDAQKNLNQELLSLEAQVQDALLEIFNRSMEKRNRAAQDRYDNEIERIDAEQKAYEDSIANRTAAEQAELDIKTGFDLQRKNAEDVLRNEQNRIAEKQFNAQKANDAASAAINTALAISKAIPLLVPPTTPLGIATIAVVSAQGLLQEGMILSQQFVPQYADGGLVIGPGTGTSDSVNAKLSNGESVINAKSTKMFAPILSAINQAGGGKAIPHLATGGLVSTTNMTSVNNDFKELKDAIYSLADRPIETYVKQTVVTNAQDTARKIKNRTTFG